MKKVKFFKSSKDLLSRGFNASKCKTSLKLGSSRLKLLRNRKEGQVIQIKREIAQLLESGQIPTARIRVEHVTREEKMMAAYDLIEIYCELIVARLPIIESQKICPIDLKEAITSVVFASPRCGDVPELLEIKKHFTEKYGKEFITAAVELRPNCGVSRMLVEKLSAVAPDGPTKIKILSEIAEEHNIKWDAESFQEKNSVPSNDVLTGPSTFVKESEIHIEPPPYEAPVVQAPKNNNSLQGSPLSFSPVVHRTEKLDSDHISGVNTASQQEARPIGDERTQSFHGENSNNLSMDKRKWSMGFKDATSAAQAAAESAELASMAARAAAELSTRERITRQCFSESRESDVRVPNDGRPERYMKSKLDSEKISEDTMDRSSYERTRSRNEQKDDEMESNNPKTNQRFKDDSRGGTKEYSQSSSLKSKASKDDDSLKEGSRGETSMQGNSFKYKAENANGWPEISKNVREERIEKQTSVKSYNSASSISDDAKTAGVVFDKSDSDNDGHVFDTGPKYDEPESIFNLPLSGQRSREHPSTNTDSWSPRSSRGKRVESDSSSLFHTRKNSSDSSESLRSMGGPKFDSSMPVTFDELDGPSYESEEDRHIGIHRHRPSKHTVGSQFKDKISQSSLKKNGSSRNDRKELPLPSDDDFPSEHKSAGSRFKGKSRRSAGSPLKKKGSSSSDGRKPSLSSDDELKFEEQERKRNRGKKPTINQPAVEPQKIRTKLNYVGNSSSESEEEGLKFKNIKGGLRHSSYNHPSYTKNQSDVSSSSGKKGVKDTATTESPGLSSKFGHKKSSWTKNLRSESDSDSSEEEEYVRKSSHRKEKLDTVSPRLSSKFEHKKSSRTKNLPSESGSDSSEEEDYLRNSSHHKQKLDTVSPRLGTKPEQKNSLRMKSLHSESDSDSSDYLRKSSHHKQKPNTVSPVKEVKTKQRLASPKKSIYGSDKSDSDKDLPKKEPPHTRINRFASGISRRTTKASPSNTPRFRSAAPDFDDDLDRKSPSSKIAENRKQSDLQRNSSNIDDQKQSTSAKVDSKPAKSKFWSPPENSNSGENQEPKTTRKPSALENLSASKLQQKPENVTVENLKVSTLNKTSSDNDGTPRASHVHPKLPDYDTFLQSFTKNRP
ncbi:hypothetical protein ABFS82_11G057800 [Erythranthe guttata]|uniref:IST1-like protein n=1 Tax=Erythranthe guttata TaxID=4155 RepID=A0A022QPN8_ERYGU|nr:PREDICTED: dentin sialophosphoprotein isoform X2 [Erythranthe guttata]EYU30662.1 hypothetical protein MIMGU_mgv1a000491mg [Erythranthe guttata]|eukprot:XP_012845490.1 PREDICTED: dentin sialophosphoprotein isoform X2 [Erythranthe guttata]